MRKKKTIISEFGIPGSAAMADLAMLLLVFFLVTTNIQQTGGLAVALPKSKVTEAIERDFRITLDKEGLLYLNEKKIQIRELVPALNDLGALPETRLSISADENLPYKIIKSVLKELKKNDLVNVQFVGAAKDK